MAKLAGKAGDVTVAGASVGGIDGWEVTYTTNTEETTDFAAVGIETHIPTTSGWKGTFSGKKDGAPLTIGTEIALVLKESQTGTQKWTGQAIVTELGASTGAKGIAMYKYNFQGTGALTIPTA